MSTPTISNIYGESEMELLFDEHSMVLFFDDSSSELIHTLTIEQVRKQITQMELHKNYLDTDAYSRVTRVVNAFIAAYADDPTLQKDPIKLYAAALDTALIWEVG